jgi:hypothetical protein
MSLQIKQQVKKLHSNLHSPVILGGQQPSSKIQPQIVNIGAYSLFMDPKPSTAGFFPQRLSRINE